MSFEIFRKFENGRKRIINIKIYFTKIYRIFRNWKKNSFTLFVNEIIRVCSESLKGSIFWSSARIFFTIFLSKASFNSCSIKFLAFKTLLLFFLLNFLFWLIIIFSASLLASFFSSLLSFFISFFYSKKKEKISLLFSISGKW